MLQGTSKRIAICLRSDFRYIDTTTFVYSRLKEIANKNGLEADFFYFGWEESETGAIVDADVIKQKCRDEGVEFTGFELAKSRIESHGQSKAYQMYSVNHMRRLHEKKANVTYAAVIMGRADLYLHEASLDSTFEELSDKYDKLVNTHWMNSGMMILCNYYGMMSFEDAVIFGSPSGMNTFCNRIINEVYYNKAQYPDEWFIYTDGLSGDWVRNRRLIPSIVSKRMLPIRNLKISGEIELEHFKTLSPQKRWKAMEEAAIAVFKGKPRGYEGNNT